MRLALKPGAGARSVGPLANIRLEPTRRLSPAAV